ncbi:MAG: putative dsRNA-binding protein, partial [Thermodesulfobacteriota bacterium]
KSRVVLLDYKTQLQEVTQKLFKETPVYTVVETRGPDHERRFISQVSVAGKPYGRGEGPNKKSADQAAALQTLRLLQQAGETQDRSGSSDPDKP